MSSPQLKKSTPAKISDVKQKNDSATNEPEAIPIAKGCDKETICELADGDYSRVRPFSSADKVLKDEMALVERVSRGRCFDLVKNRRSTIALHVATKLRVCAGDILQDHPSWRVPLAGYMDAPRMLFVPRAIFHRVAGCIRDLEPVREHRGPRGGGGWSTKAVLADNAYKSLLKANKELLRLLGRAQGDTDKTHDSMNCPRHDRGKMIKEIVDLTRDLSAARAESQEEKSLHYDLKS